MITVVSGGIEVGDPVALEWTSDECQVIARGVVRALDENTVALTFPEDESEVPINVPVKATVLTRLGLLHIESKVEARTSEGAYLLSLPGPAKTAQRRSFVRIDARVPAQVSISNRLPFACESMDISGGGLRLRALDPAKAKGLKDGARGRLELNLGTTNRPLEIGFRVTRVVENDAKASIFSLEFTAIREPDREQVVRFIMKQQRSQRTQDD